MAKAERTEVYDVPLEKFYKVIVDYASYPQFVDGVTKVEVLKPSQDSPQIKMTVNVIKEISYTINLKHEENKSVSWSLVTGDYMKLNNGGWKLKDLGNGKTEVTYHLEIEVKGFIPGLSLIEKTLVTTNLPLTMRAFSKRAQSI